ncbi:MAG: extracellular solute-binding protein [Deltaproteobacteria bacterium]|nr:extracellular solute-binding protein [Deltaproteobacteria bacterium]
MLRVLAVLNLFVAISVFPVWAASSSPGFGDSVEQAGRLAVKEGRVRVSASLDGDEIGIVLDGFQKKYPAIKVEYTTSTGVDSGERIFTEALSGHVEYDVMKVVYELQGKFIKAGVLAGPFKWEQLFPKTPKEHISPHGYMVGGSFYPRVIAYNPTLVPPERVPRKWEDCLDPYWTGRFVADVRPATLLGLYPAWGEQRVIEYAKKIKENRPIWERGMSKSIALLASGEYPMICGTAYSSIRGLLRRDPGAKVRIAWPNEVPVGLNEALGVLKGAKNPNAALLLAGWLASPEAQRGYDKVGRGSPFLEGTEARKEFQKAGAKAIFSGWNEGEYAPGLTKKITAIWGFPGKKG